jgi:hypothetical protein
MRNTSVTQMAEPSQNSREAPPRKQRTKLCALASFRDIKTTLISLCVKQRNVTRKQNRQINSRGIIQNTPLW